VKKYCPVNSIRRVYSGEAQPTRSDALKANPVIAIDGPYFAIDQVIPRSSAIKARHEQPTTIIRTKHRPRGPQYQRWQKTLSKPPGHVKAAEIARQPLTSSTGKKGDAQRRTKAKLSPSHLHKGSKAKERKLRDPVFQTPPKGATLGAPSYRIGRWSLVMVPLRRWRG
jgi:hypothetical protein